MRTDRNYVRTAQDLERKYNFSGIEKNVEMNKEEIIKVNNELEEFAGTALADINVLKNQVDGNVTTWFFAGEPTLLNEPASEWESTDYDNHINDLYYDTNTGYAYQFLEDNGVYSWVRQENSDISEALALANAAQDTADNKRRVFVTQPVPPYDNGDLWFNDMELYRCQISKTAGQTFENDDFIIATKYTDDTVANKVNDDLEVVRGTVLTIKDNVDEFKIQFDTTTETLTEGLQRNTESIESMAYSFGTDDLQISKSDDPVYTRINNQGLKVYSYSDLKAIFNQNGSGIQKLIVVGDSQLANISIVKAVDDNNNACTDFHHLVSNIQDLTDLE